jgi:hypothetical protein
MNDARDWAARVPDGVASGISGNICARMAKAQPPLKMRSVLADGYLKKIEERYYLSSLGWET